MGIHYQASRYRMTMKVFACALLCVAAAAADIAGLQTELDQCKLENMVHKAVISNVNVTATDLVSECTVEGGFNCTVAILAAGATEGAALVGCISASMAAPAACAGCICEVISHICVPFLNMCLHC